MKMNVMLTPLAFDMPKSTRRVSKVGAVLREIGMNRKRVTESRRWQCVDWESLSKGVNSSAFQARKIG